MHYSTIVLALVTTIVSLGSAIPVDSNYSEVATRDLESKIATRGSALSKVKDKAKERKGKAEAKEASKHTRLQDAGMNKKQDTVDITVCIHKISYLKKDNQLTIYNRNV